MADNQNVILLGVLAAGAVFLLSRRARAATTVEGDVPGYPGTQPPGTKPPSTPGTQPPGTQPPTTGPSGGGSSGGGSSGGGPSVEETEAIVGAQGALNEFRESVRLGFTNLSSSQVNSLLASFPAPLALDGNAGSRTLAATRAFAAVTGQALELFTPPGLRGAGGWWNVSDAVNDWLDANEAQPEAPVTGDERTELQRRIQTALNRLRNTPTGTSTTYLEWFNQVRNARDSGITYVWESLSVDGVVGSRTNAAYNAFRLGAVAAANNGALPGSRRTLAEQAIGRIPGDIMASLSAAMQLPVGNRAALTTIANALEQLAGISRA